jgi:4-hydroxy-tetrahydrodipicolinate reductase
MRRYGAILRKFGLGLTPADFDTERDAGRVMGHVGFAQSISALARGLEWDLDAIEVDAVERDMIAETERKGQHTVIAAGTVTSVLHRARGLLQGKPVIELATRFGIFDPEDAVERGGGLVIVGREQTIEVAVPGGFESLLSTVAMASNVVTAVVEAAPGFRTVEDLPVGALASKGACVAP